MNVDAGRGGEVLWGLCSDRFKDNIASGLEEKKEIEAASRRRGPALLPWGRGGGEPAGAGSFPEGRTTDGLSDSVFLAGDGRGGLAACEARK